MQIDFDIRPRVRRLLAAAVCATLAIPGAAQAQSNAWVEPFGVGTSEYAGGGARLFVPFAGNADSTAFTQLGVTATDDRGTVGSLGVGYRTRLGAENVVGMNLFIDYGETDTGNDFWGVGLGGEYLGNIIEARVNAYMPMDTSGEFVGGGFVGDRVVFDGSGTAFTETTGPYREYPLYRVEGEIGPRLDLSGGDRNMELGLYGGAFYHWSDEDLVDDYSGVTGRFELSMHDIGLGEASLHIGGFARYDDVRDDEYGAMVSLTLPIGGDESAYPDPLYRRVERDPLVVTQVARDLTRTPITDDSGAPLSGEVVRTQSALINALNNADNDIVAIDGRVMTTQPVTFGNSNLLITGNGTGIIDGSGLPSGPEGDLLIVDNSSSGITIRDLTITNAPDGGEGIQLGQDVNDSGVTDVLIENVTITNVDGHGIYMNGVGEVTVRNSTIDGAGSSGIIVTRNSGNDSDVLIEGNTIRNATLGSAVFAADDGDQIIWRDNVFGQFDVGILSGVGGPPGTPDLTFEGNSFVNGSTGLQLDNGRNLIAGNSFSDVDTVVNFNGGTVEVLAGSNGNTAVDFVTLCTGTAQSGATLSFDAGNCVP